MLMKSFEKRMNFLGRIGRISGRNTVCVRVKLLEGFKVELNQDVIICDLRNNKTVYEKKGQKSKDRSDIALVIALTPTSSSSSSKSPMGVDDAALPSLLDPKSSPLSLLRRLFFAFEAA